MLNNPDSVVSLLFYLVILAALFGSLAGGWKLFQKAGRPGWAVLVPVYGFMVLLEIVDRPMWWILLCIFLWPVGMILVGMDLARAFGKRRSWGAVFFGLLFFIGYPMIGFGSARYSRISRQ